MFKLWTTFVVWVYRTMFQDIVKAQVVLNIEDLLGSNELHDLIRKGVDARGAELAAAVRAEMAAELAQCVAESDTFMDRVTRMRAFKEQVQDFLDGMDWSEHVTVDDSDIRRGIERYLEDSFDVGQAVADQISDWLKRNDLSDCIDLDELKDDLIGKVVEEIADRLSVARD